VSIALWVRDAFGGVAPVGQALEKAGVEFIDENGGGPGVRLKKDRPKPAI
jgi:hypothetical protein